MTKFNVIEIFTSINGEGFRAGELAVFIRLKGCNLRCGYCDTMYANVQEAPCEELTADEIVERVLSEGVRNVTLTGGEPLLKNSSRELVAALSAQKFLNVELETNGSIDLTPYLSLPRVTFTMDYKLPSSGMEKAMRTENFALLRACDTVKFVAGDENDLTKALYVIQKYDLTRRCHVYLSPVFGELNPAEIVEFMKRNKLNEVRLQLQLHKFIWNPNARGV